MDNQFGCKSPLIYYCRGWPSCCFKHAIIIWQWSGFVTFICEYEINKHGEINIGIGILANRSTFNIPPPLPFGSACQFVLNDHHHQPRDGVMTEWVICVTGSDDGRLNYLPAADLFAMVRHPGRH